MSLQPGDMCVILQPTIPCAPHEQKLVGRVVILRRIEYTTGPWAPHWSCTNVPRGIQVSEFVLRKIPPAPMEINEDETETIKARIVSSLRVWAG